MVQLFLRFEQAARIIQPTLPGNDRPFSDRSRLADAKKLLAGSSKRFRGEAREKSTSGGVLTVRRSEAIERQRSIWVFFSSLLEIS